MKKSSKVSKVWEVGKNYFVRTVTHIQVGRLVCVTDKELVLEKASWIADTGRFANALKNGIENESSSEIEPFPEKSRVIIGRGSIVDAVIYQHDLPNKQK